MGTVWDVFIGAGPSGGFSTTDRGTCSGRVAALSEKRGQVIVLVPAHDSCPMPHPSCCAFRVVNLSGMPSMIVAVAAEAPPSFTHSAG